jgi:type 1 fimbria pilin
MKKQIGIFLTNIVFLLLTAWAAIAAANATFTGTVTDTMCGKKHMIAGKSDADCTRECMKSKGNWTYGLVVGDKVYSLSGDNQKFASLAGQRVKVTGEQSDIKIAVQSIAPAP